MPLLPRCSTHDANNLYNIPESFPPSVPNIWWTITLGAVWVMVLITFIRKSLWNNHLYERISSQTHLLLFESIQKRIYIYKCFSFWVSLRGKKYVCVSIYSIYIVLIIKLKITFLPSAVNSSKASPTLNKNQIFFLNILA